MTTRINLSDVIFDTEIYPREKWNSKTVECLQAVYDCGTVRKAAKKLGCSQTYLYNHLPQESIVYFLVSGGKVKIGTTQNCVQRFKSLRSANPHESRLAHILPGNKDLERQLHDKFQMHRIGGEWFEAAPVLKEMRVGQNG